MRSDAFSKKWSPDDREFQPRNRAPELGELLVRVPPQSSKQSLTTSTPKPPASDALIEKKKRMIELLKPL